MKNTIVLILLLIFITGCSFLPKKEPVVETVYVDKMVPFCPVPPTLPEYDYLVDSLVDEDINNPGKVGVAYKRDMYLLRKVIRIQREIINEYRNTSQNFDAVNEKINNLLKE